MVDAPEAVQEAMAAETTSADTNQTVAATESSSGGGFWGFVSTLKEKGGSAMETLAHDLDEFTHTITADTTKAIDTAGQKAGDVLVGRRASTDAPEAEPMSASKQAPAKPAAAPPTTATSTSKPPSSQQPQHSALEDIGDKVESMTTSLWTMGTALFGGKTDGDDGAGGATVTPMASASEARLHSLQQSEATYTSEPSGADSDAYLAFSEELNLPLMTDEISRMMADYPLLRQMHNRLVPHAVSYQTFWRRYLFRLKQFQADAERRSRIVNLSTSVEETEDDGDFNWDSDGDDTPTPAAAETASKEPPSTIAPPPPAFQKAAEEATPAPAPVVEKAPSVQVKPDVTPVARVAAPTPTPPATQPPVTTPTPVITEPAPAPPATVPEPTRQADLEPAQILASAETMRKAPTPLSSDDSSWTDAARSSTLEGGSSSDGGWTNLQGRAAADDSTTVPPSPDVKAVAEGASVMGAPVLSAPTPDSTTTPAPKLAVANVVVDDDDDDYDDWE